MRWAFETNKKESRLLQDIFLSRSDLAPTFMSCANWLWGCGDVAAIEFIPVMIVHTIATTDHSFGLDSRPSYYQLPDFMNGIPSRAPLRGKSNACITGFRYSSVLQYRTYIECLRSVTIFSVRRESFAWKAPDYVNLLSLALPSACRLRLHLCRIDAITIYVFIGDVCTDARVLWYFFFFAYRNIFAIYLSTGNVCLGLAKQAETCRMSPVECILCVCVYECVDIFDTHTPRAVLENRRDTSIFIPADGSIWPMITRIAENIARQLKQTVYLLWILLKMGIWEGENITG